MEASTRPTSIAAVQQPCGQEKVLHALPHTVGFTELGHAMACSEPGGSLCHTNLKAAELFLPALETPGNCRCKDRLALVLTGNGHSGHHHAYA